MFFVMDKFGYNPSVDRQDVDQFGFVNLNEAFENGIIPANAGMTDESFNGVAAPGILLPRSQDVFESLRKTNYVQSILRSKAAVSKERADLAKEVSEKTPGVVSE